MSISQGLLLGCRNTHLPLRQRIKVALQERSRPSVDLSKVFKAVHLRQNAIKYAERNNINLEFIEDVYGKEWYNEFFTGSESLRNLATLFRQAVQFEKTITPESYDPLESEIETVLQDYLKHKVV